MFFDKSHVDVKVTNVQLGEVFEKHYEVKQQQKGKNNVDLPVERIMIVNRFEVDKEGPSYISYHELESAEECEELITGRPEGEINKPSSLFDPGVRVVEGCEEQEYLRQQVDAVGEVKENIETGVTSGHVMDEQLNETVNQETVQ